MVGRPAGRTEIAEQPAMRKPFAVRTPNPLRVLYCRLRQQIRLGHPALFGDCDALGEANANVVNAGDNLLPVGHIAGVVSDP